MIPPQPRDPRESALGLQVSAALNVVCQIAAVVLLLAGLPDRAVLPGVLAQVFLVIGYIVGAVWFRRCWANAALLADDPLPFGPGRALAGWLVPVLNVWMRWRLLLALRRAGGAPVSATAVHLWWGLHLAANGVAVAGMLGIRTVGTLLGSTVVSAVSAVVFVLIVRRITARQVELLPPAPAAEPVAV